jgi:hypothetical protein
MMLSASAQAFAGVLYSTGFEPPTYTTGALAGQDGWTGTLGTVETATVFGATQAVGYDATGAPFLSQLFNSHAVPGGQGSLVEVTDEFLVSAADRNVNWENLTLFGNASFVAEFVIIDGIVGLVSLGNLLGTMPVTVGAWHDYELDVNFATDMVAGYVDGNLIGAGSFGAANTALTVVDLGINNTNGLSTSQAFVDNLSITAVTAVPEPSAVVLWAVGLSVLCLSARIRVIRGLLYESGGHARDDT